MASSGNFCVWNLLNIGSGGSTTLSEGNLRCAMTGADPRTTGTLGGTIADSDGFYFETVATDIGGGALTLGIVNDERHDKCMNEQIHSRSGSYMWRPYSSGQFFDQTSTVTSYGAFANGDILGWFIKSSKLYVKKNNSDVVGDVSAGTGGISLSGTYFFPAVSRTVGGGSGTDCTLRPDSDSWSYTPPDGFKGLTSKDISISDDIDPAGDDGEDENPTKQMNVIKYTGNDGTTSNNINYGFKPDLVIHKDLDGIGGGYPPQVWDTTRGDDYYMYPTGTAASTTSGSDYLEFTSTGVKLDNNWDGINHNGGNYVSQGWRANGGTTVTNTQGSVSNTLQANAKGGFSISQFGNSSGACTIGHGLGKAPAFYIVKIASSTSSWGIYHKSLGATKYVRFNSTNAPTAGSNYFNDTEPTSTVLSIGSTWTGTTIMCYAWAEIEGYSKFSSYTGNGSTDGACVYLGFRPKLVVLRRNSGGENWFVFDSARETSNVVGKYILWDYYGAEAGSNLMDFTSTGFKLRSSSASLNPSGGEVLYMAWGDVPAKYGNTF